MADSLLIKNTKTQLRRVFGNELERDFAEIAIPHAGITEWDDEFLGDTLNGTYQSTAAGSGSPVAAAIEAGIVNGQIKLDAGSSVTASSDLTMGVHFQGQLNAVMACRVKINAITNIKLEVGFTDTVSGTDVGAVNVAATPTFTASDAAVWVVDTNATDANYRICAVATDASQISAADGLVGAGPTADTYETLIVALRDSSVKFLRLDVDGRAIYESPWLNGPTKTVNLTPWVFVQNRSGTNHFAQIDRLYVYQRKTTNS